MIITLSGPNHFAIKSELENIENAFLKENDALSLEKLDGSEASLDRIREAIQSLPFLSTRKMVILDNPSRSKVFLEASEQLILGVPDTTDVVIIEDKVDKRLSYYKLIKTKTDYREYGHLEKPALIKWLSDYAKSLGGTLQAADAAYLVERVGTEQQLLANELDKLVLYEPDIVRANIDALTERAPQSTIFDLLDSAFAGNVRRTMDLYDEQRALKVEPQQIIAMLAWQLHVLAIVKTAGSRSVQDIAKEARLNPYVVQKTRSMAGKISESRLKQLVGSAKELDVALKSRNIDADDALRLFLLEITSS